MRPIRRSPRAPMAVALAAIAGVGCAHAPELRCPAAGGPAWRQVESPHFVVQTDLPSKEARALAEEFERVHAVLQRVPFQNVPDTGQRIRVVSFGEDRHYEAFAPPGAGAYYLRSRAGFPTIVMPGLMSDFARATIAHELTHHLLARTFVRQPPWFAEGIATYMESIGATRPWWNKPALGGVPLDHAERLHGFTTGAGSVLVAKRLDAQQYSVAWLVVHYLLNAHGARFTELQRRFARGDDPAVAWREVFPEWNPADAAGMASLDRALREYIEVGRYAYREVTLGAPPPTTERTLGSAEVHAIWLDLPRQGSRGPGAPSGLFEAEVAEALAEDPSNVTALAARAFLAPGEAAALGRRATEAHPTDPRAWLLLARSLPPGPEREPAYRKAIEVGPEEADALNSFAWHLVMSEREGEAIPLAVRAVRVAPWNFAMLDTLAAALQGVGRCSEALVVQRRASDLLPEGMPEQGREPILERLQALEASCGNAKGAAPVVKPAGG